MAQPNQSGGGGASGPVQLIKPNMVDTLPHFDQRQKEHYKNGLTTLWQQLENNPRGSQAFHEAENKIRAASVKIMQQLAQTRSGARPTSGGGPVQRPSQGPQGDGQQQAMGQNMQQPGGQQPGQGQQQPQYSEYIRNQMKQLSDFQIPPQIQQQGQEAMKTYKQQMMRKAMAILQKKEGIMKKGQQLQAQSKALENQGQQVPENMAAELAKCRVDVNTVSQEWETFKRTVAPQGASMQKQGSSQGTQQNGAQQQSQPMQRTTSQNMSTSEQQPDAKMSMGQPAHSPVQAQSGFQQQQQQNQIAPSPAPQNMSQPPSAYPQQTPQSATQSQQPQFPQQNNMQQQSQQQQQRPMNPQMVRQGMSQQQHPQQHAQASMPANQQQQQQQRPQPHTHQSALHQASIHRQQSQQNMQQQDQSQNQPQVPNSLPFNGPPSATQQTPPSAYPLQTNSTGSSSSTKFPIPKQLNIDPRMQQPVQGPPSRPTFNNAGMMSQPGVQRPAQFTLEGEGDRVLSKRKLDELVRQVTGSPADGSVDSGLAPEVEEAVLTLADDFVDNVITSACRLAKLRPNQTLDIKDIQIVLERNYGIRIPGFALDEVRTVRKFQPAAGWQSKMQAVQAGKVMGKDKE